MSKLINCSSVALSGLLVNISVLNLLLINDGGDEINTDFTGM